MPLLVIVQYRLTLFAELIPDPETLGCSVPVVLAVRFPATVTLPKVTESGV
jgi:hypothetical protein